MIIEEETEDSFIYQFNEIGRKTSTGGWFVSEGELAHDDGSCSFYDIANCDGSGCMQNEIHCNYICRKIRRSSFSLKYGTLLKKWPFATI
ncbi:hypothetical protein ACSBR1_006829 [Camellia fascicularis]